MSEPEPASPSPERPTRRRSPWAARMGFPKTVAAEDELPESLAVAGVYPTRKAAAERGLVILSMKLGYWLFPAPNNQWRLAVRPSRLAEVKAQLDKYESEQVVRPKPLEWPTQETNWWVWLTWCSLLCCVHLAGGGSEGWMTPPGAFLSERVFVGGEWWRLFTAQTLHADYGHLVGNLFGIILFGWVASRGVGAGLALSGSVLAGALAFAGSAWWKWPVEHASLGASSTVFAALGVVTGQSLLSGWVLDWRGLGKSLMGPLLGGLAFLGMFGGGGEGGRANTDLMAHLAGFLSGLPFGIVGAWLVWRGKAGISVQVGAGVAAGAAIVAAWVSALL